MAKVVRRHEALKVLGTIRHNRATLMMSTALQAVALVVVSLPALAQPAPNAQPTGGTVVGGAATIGKTATTTTINQTTQRTAIDWQSFNVGSEQRVTFNQPNASAVALNRVVGPNPSQIAGKIDANGQIILQNQSGVTFYNGAQVNTNGLMVTAVGITNQNFMNGNMVFDQAANPNAKVVNQGTLTVRGAGLAALVAPGVANSGTITAKMGNVVLAGAQAVTLDMYGDGLVSVNVTRQVTQAPDGTNALVTNTGVIRASGGTVTLTAAAADGVVTKLVSAGGTIAANTVGNKAGTISIAGVGGDIEITGQLSAQGLGVGLTGGAIQANATGNVTLRSTAVVNASGKAGGGTVAIGTTLARAQGGPSVMPAAVSRGVSVATGATIAASATDRGNGGRIAVLSTGTTTFAGSILARGGPNGGNGGFVETSGATLILPASALVDTRAPLGTVGTWLLDPVKFTIATSGGDGTPGQVVTALKTSNVTILADNDITVSNAIDATTDPLAVNGLILRAGRSIAINANITLNGGAFTATANDSIDAGLTAAARGAGAGGITMAGGTAIDTHVGGANITMSVGVSAAAVSTGGAFAPGTISLAGLTTGGGNITTSGDTGLVLAGNIAAGAGAVNFTSGGTVNQSGGTVGAAGLAVTAAGAVTLANANAVGTIAGTISTSGSAFAFNNTATGLTVGIVGGVTGITTNNGNVSLKTTTSGDLSLTQNIGAGTGTVALTSAGSIVQSGGSVTAAGLALTAASTVSLPDANAVGTIAGMIGTAGQGFAFNNTSNGLTVDTVGGVAGITTSNGNVSLTTTTSGDIGINQTINAGTGTLTLSSAGNIGQPGGSIVAGVLIGNANSFVVGNITNLIGTIGAVTSTLFHFFSNSDTTIEATVSSSASSYIEAIGNLTVLGSGSVVGTGNVTLDGAYGLTLNSGAVVGHAGVQVDLWTPYGLATQAASSTIIAGTLTSGQGFKNGATLLGTANAIGLIGGASIGVNAGAGDFTLVNAGSVGVTGPLTGAGTVSIKSGTIGVSGSLSATTLLALAAGAGGISLGTGHVLSAPTIDLSASGGGVTQVATGGTIDASTILQSTAGMTGIVSLLGSANTIAAVGNFAVTSGDFLLNDGTALAIAGNVHAASGNISLTEAAGQGVTLAATNGSLTASGTVSVQADTLAFNTGATITGQVFEYAPVTAAALTIGGGASNIPSLTQVGVQRLRLGAVRGLTPTATSISFGANFSPAAAIALDLETQGNIADGGFALTNISTLSGNVANAGSVVLTASGNGIATLGSFAVAGGDFNLKNAGSLNDNGVVTAQNITLNAGTLGIAGFLNAGTTVVLGVTAGGVTEAGGSIAANTLTSNGTVVGGATLTSNTNTIATLANFAVSAGGFSLTSTGSLNVAGTVSGPNIGLNAGTIGIAGFVNASTAVALGASAGGVTESGSITASTLTSIGTISGGLTLTGTNTIPALGNIVVVNGSLSVSSYGDISVSGNVSSDADVVILGTGAASAINVTGSVTGASPTAGLVKIGGGSGGVTLATSGHYVSAGTVDLFANGGTVTQSKTTSGSIYAATLQSTGGSTSVFSIRGTLNTIGALGVINVGGAQEITSKGALTLKNAITANSLTLTAGGSITDNGTALLTVGTLYIYTTAAGNVSLTNTNDKIGEIAGVSLFAGGLKVIDDPTLILSGTQIASSFYYMVSKAGDGIQLGNGTTPLLLTASGGGRISLIGDTFTHNDGGGANQLVTTGVVEIAPLTNTVAMSIGGTTNLVQIDSTLLNSIQAGTLIAGSYLNGSTTITAASVLLDGNVSAASVGTLRIATLGTVHQSAGSVIASGLGISAGGASDLTGANAIGTIAASITGSAQSFILDNTSANLTVDTVAGIAGIATNNGTVTLVTSTAGDVTLKQSINAGTAAIWLSSAGTIGQTGGSLTATALTGTAAGGVALSKTNSIGTLLAFSVTGGDFSLVDGTAMSIGGNVSASNVFLEAALNGGTIAIGSNVTVQATATSNPRATFVADTVTAGPSSGITTTNGSIEVSAFGVGSALTVGASLSASISAGSATSVLLGHYTDVPNGGTTVSMTGNLIVPGTVVANNITATAGTIAVSGFLNAGTTLALGASAGGITEAGSISAATLVSVGTITGGTTLESINNSIGTLGNFALATGALSVNDTGTLAIAGTIGGPSISLSASQQLNITGSIGATATLALGAGAGGITESGSITAVHLIGINTIGGDVSLTGTNRIGTLGGGGNLLSAGSLIVNNGTDLAIANTVSAANAVSIVSSGMIDILSAGGVAGTTVALTGTATSVAGTAIAVDGSIASAGTGGGSVRLTAVTGGISGGGEISTGTLSGQADGTATVNGSAIATLASFAANGLSVTDTLATGATLTVSGPVNGGTAGVTLAVTTTSPGTGTASIAIPGSITAGTLIDLISLTNAGTISGDGILTAPTLAGSAASGISLTGTAGGGTVSANTIGTLAAVTVTGGDFFLADTGNLTVTGVVASHNIALSAGTIGIAGTGFLNATTTVALGASAGGISAPGSITAGTLVSLGTVTGGATIAATNTIGRLGDFTVAGGALVFSSTGSVDVAGTIAAPNATLVAGTLAVSGVVNVGTLLLIGATGGPLTESGSITAGTLVGFGVNTGGVTLAGTNTIRALGNFTAGGSGFLLNDSGSLSVLGLVSAPSVTLMSGTLDIAGQVSASARLSLGASLGGITESTGTVIAGTLVSNGTVTGGMTLNTATNTIGALGVIAIATGSLMIADKGSLAVVGPVSASNISLTAGTIGIGGTLNAGTVLALGANAGGLTESGSISAATLTSSGTINGNATLNGTNMIAALGSFAVTGGDFSLANIGALALASEVDAKNITVQSTGSIGFSSASFLHASTNVALGSGVAIVQATGTISGTLISAGTVQGGVAITSSTNTIPALGGFSVAGGDFSLTTTGSLSVIGAVSAPNIALNPGALAIASSGFLNAATTVALGASAGNVTEAGSISAATLVGIGTMGGNATLNGTNTIATVGAMTLIGALTLNDTAALTVAGTVAGASASINPASLTVASGGVLNAGSVTIITSAGGVTESGTGRIIANTLSIATTGAGDVSLTNTNNQISASNGIQVANGNLILVDDPTLTLTGPFSADNLFFQVTQPGDTIALSTTTLTAAANGRISLIADNLTDTASTKIAAPNGTVEIAPFSTTVAESLSGAAQMAVDSNLLAGIGTGTLTIGGYTDVTRVTPGQSITAANITLAATNLTGVANTLNILTLGSIAGAAGALVVGTLSGTAASGVAFSSTANNIGVLGSFGVASGGFALVDNGNTGNLNVTGPITASSVSISDANTGTITVSGLINAPALLSLAAGSGGVKFSTGTILTSTTVDLSAAGGGLIQGVGDGIVATILQSTSGVAGTVLLNSALNNVGTLGRFALTTGDFILADNGNTGRMTVGGPVTATGSIAISNANTGTIAVVGSIGAATALILSSGSGGIQLNTGGILSGATVDLSAPSGGVTQVSTGAIVASTVLRSASGVTGTVNLAGTGNTIASVGSFAVGGGDFTLVDSGALDVVGKLTATNVALNSATIAVTGSIGATTALTLASGGGGIRLNTGEILSGATVDLSATGGGVTQISSGTIVASTVLQSTSGVTGSVALAGTGNTIASVGSFAVSGGDFTLVDTGNLGVAGQLTATNIALSSATIAVSGSVGATIALTLASGGGGIQLNTGAILSGATVDLSATGGGVTQVSTGTIAARTVLRSASGVTGTVNLAGTANNVASLGSFAVTTGDFVLTDNGNSGRLSVTGPLTANNATVIGAGTIAVSGSIGATTSVVVASGAGGIQLNGGGILHGVIVDLSATGGGVTESGTGSIIASGALQSTAGVTGTVALTNPGNNIAAVGSFAVSAGDFILADNGFAGAFDVTGLLTANNVAISGLGTVTLTGGIGATTGLTLGVGTGGVQLVGAAILSGATVDLSVTGGGVTQTGRGGVGTGTGSIVASAILQSTSGVTGTVNLSNPGNTIAGLGKFAVTSGDFVLGDAGQAGNLTVSGPVTATNVTIGGASALTVAGSIGATTLVTLAAGAGGIALTGSAIVNGPTVDVSSTGSVSEAAGGSVIASNVLRSSNGVVGSVALTSAANNVASLGSFVLTSGNFVLVDTGNTGNLTVTGPVTAANVSIMDGNAGTISVSGSIGAAGFLALASGLGGIRLDSGATLTAATVDLSTTGGGINQVAGGVVGVTDLTSSNGIVGALVLPSSANQIGAITNVTVAGDLTLVNSIAMSLAGQVSVGHGGTVNISTSAGSVTQASSGTLIADTFTSGGGIAGNLSLVGGGNRIGTLSAVTAIGLLAVADSNALTLAGLISAGGGIVDLSTSAGGVTQAAGSALIAAALTSSGNIAGTLTLASGLNQIGVLSGLSAGGLTLFDATGLTLANLVSVGGAGTMDITTPGGINQSTASVLIAGTLTSSGGLGGATALLGAGNQIRSVNNIAVASGNLSLTDSIDLAVNAKLSAHQITVTDTGQTVSFANGAQIVTDGITRPPGTILPADLPTALRNTNGGAYFTVANFQQTGTLNASNLNGSGNILRIDATGTVAFDPVAGLNGPNTWLIMSLIDGARTIGSINVKALDVNYVGAGGGASLSGSINGVSGQAAASLANIVPGTNGEFKINTCALHAVNCIILTAEGIPQIAPNSEIVFAIPFIPSFDDNQDIVVPLVSDSNDTTLFESDIDKKEKDRRRKDKHHEPITERSPPVAGGNEQRTERGGNVFTPAAVAERDVRLAQDGG